MSLSPLEYLRHIRDETIYLMNESEGLTRDMFEADETLQRAFVRSLEVIGEAAKNVPDDFRQSHSHIDWRAMAGMRDRLIHSYFGVDYDIVWDVIVNKVPVLRHEIEALIFGQESGS